MSQDGSSGNSGGRRIAYFIDGAFGSGPDPLPEDASWEDAPPGWSVLERIGQENGFSLTIFSRLTGNPGDPHWLVAINDPDTWEMVGVRHLRDLWDLLARWAPVASAAVLSAFYDELFGPEMDWGASGYLTRLLGRIRADEAAGYIDRAAQEITRQRRERHRKWAETRAARQQQTG